MEQKLEQKLEVKKRMNRRYRIIILLPIIALTWLVVFFAFKNEKTYSLKEYYPDTKQTDVSEYVIRNGDTIVHGKFVRYNEKGNKIAEGNFVNGEPNGKSVYYFNNGKIESIFYRKNSKITEENIDNFPSGKIMRYTSYGDSGLSAFIIRFDEGGNVENYKGYPIMEIYQYKITNKRFKVNINQYLKVGDTLKHQYIIANIPNTKRTVKIENLDVDNTKVKRTFKKTTQVGIEVKEVLIKKGINKIRAIVKYEFHDKEKTVINDTISFEVNVN
ncbi:hypothetical protein [Flavobacterium sp. N1736]|uniref:hypothetical protein n=1 Tax=Flavobacterium sp. N1736 TaxID=2986823 RepID=UPI0022241295|nr:hypothetical protein [Flavobacterium sp. N1736]